MTVAFERLRRACLDFEDFKPWAQSLAFSYLPKEVNQLKQINY